MKELVKVVQEFETLQSFLEHVSLVTDQVSAPGEETLSIMTLHMAKGLEFETVFLAGCEEGLFPSPKTLEEHGQKGLEEERPLAFVGLTRAKKRVIVSFAWNRRSYQGWQQASPSRFIQEFTSEHIEAHFGHGTQPFRSPHSWRNAKGPLPLVPSAETTKKFLTATTMFHPLKREMWFFIKLLDAVLSGPQEGLTLRSLLEQK